MRRAIAESFGGIVLRPRDGAGGYEVVVCGKMTPGTWQLPKGTPNGGESAEETAAREVREETGLEVEIIGKVGEINYTFVGAPEYTEYDKTVAFYLMAAIGGDLADHDHEFDAVEWRDVASALEQLTFENESRILETAIAMAEDRASEGP